MHARRRRGALAIATAAALAVLGACTVSTSGTARSGPAEAAPVLDRFYAQQLAWGPCADYATDAEDRAAFADPTFDCARLEVPLDYAATAGRTARIGVLRHRAAGDRIGSLVLNPGGPGASGMALVPALSGRLADGPLTRRFDLVGFDPRGVGASTPTIDCSDDADWEVERADLDVDPSPAGIEQTETENRQYAQRCTERSGGAEVLANVGTRDVVRDLDILRAVLGDEKLTYLGYSYGTRLGSAYAEAFPQRVRALVLDGALDPTETTVESSVGQAAGFQAAFDAYAADCVRQRACPLGTDPTRATATFQRLTRPLIDFPAPVQGGRRLSYNDAVTAANQALYVSRFWPILSRGLSALGAGDGTILMALADLYYGRAPDGRYGNLIEAFVSISCVDEERISDRSVQTDLQTRVNRAAPFRDSGRGIVVALEPCAFWPVPPTSRPHVPQVDGLPPTLVISTTGDPATPYQAGVDLASALRGELVTFEGNQHTVALQGNPCIDDLVTAYLIDLQTPPDRPRCTL